MATRRLFHFCAHKQHSDGRLEYRDGVFDVGLPIDPKTFSSAVRSWIAAASETSGGERMDAWVGGFILDSVTFVTDFDHPVEAEVR